MSRVRENCMHGSRWRREETGDGRQSLYSSGASHRPYHNRERRAHPPNELFFLCYLGRCLDVAIFVECFF